MTLYASLGERELLGRESEVVVELRSMAVQQAMTLEQFLVWESQQELKHEYYRGRVLLHNEIRVAMPGGSTPHNRIERNLVVALGMAFKRTGNEVFTSNQMVMSVVREVGFYPDATVLAEPLQKGRYGTMEAISNPAVVFEVASRSTNTYDRTYKLDAYRTIPSMREIILVGVEEARIERHVRTAEGWRLDTFFGLEGALPVLDRTIALADVYEGIDLTSDPFPG